MCHTSFWSIAGCLYPPGAPPSGVGESGRTTPCIILFPASPRNELLVPFWFLAGGEVLRFNEIFILHTEGSVIE
jgi:hypothetical protein